MPRPIVAFDADAATPVAASSTPPWTVWVLGGVAVLQVAGFVKAALGAAVLKPFSDQYDLIKEAWAWRDGALSLPAYLWAPHVGHHMVWQRILTALEVSAVGSAWPTLVAAGAALALAAILLAIMARDRRLTTFAAASPLVCGLLMLDGFNAMDVGEPINALYPLCVVFLLAALILFEPPAGSRRPHLRRGLGLAAAMAACLGNGAAIVLFPILALAAFTGPAPKGRLWAAITAGVMVVFAGLYFGGSQEMAQLGGAGADGSPVQRLVYLFAFLALPWSQATMAGGALVGVALVAVAAFAVWTAWRAGPTRTDRLAIGLILFAGGAALLAGAARTGVDGVFRVPIRYAVFAVLFQAGLVMLLAPMAERRLAGRPAAALGVILAALAFLLVQQAAALAFTWRAAERVRTVIAAFERGERTPDMEPLIYPQLGRIAAAEARLRAERVFGKAPQELAQPAASAGGRTP